MFDGQPPWNQLRSTAFVGCIGEGKDVGKNLGWLENHPSRGPGNSSFLGIGEELGVLRPLKSRRSPTQLHNRTNQEPIIPKATISKRRKDSCKGCAPFNSNKKTFSFAHPFPFPMTWTMGWLILLLCFFFFCEIWWYASNDKKGRISVKTGAPSKLQGDSKLSLAPTK